MKKRSEISYNDYIADLFYDPKVPLESNESMTRNVTFQVTDDCNLCCKYCLAGNTPILMSDFTTKPISEIKVGDKVMGFDEYGDPSSSKRDVIYETTVKNVFHRKSNVLKLSIQKNRSLVITPNHKVLARRNRKNHSYDYREAGKLKVGQTVYAVPPYWNIDIMPKTFDEDYKIGYVIGAFKGDGSVKKYNYPNTGRPQDMFKIRLAVKDVEIVRRTKEFLDDLGIDTYIKKFEVSKKYNLVQDAIFSNTRATYDSIYRLYEDHFLKNKTPSYYKGFLAGIYDTEGSISNGKSLSIRISNTDEDIIKQICEALDAIGVCYAVSDTGSTKNKKHR